MRHSLTLHGRNAEVKKPGGGDRKRENRAELERSKKDMRKDWSGKQHNTTNRQDCVVTLLIPLGVMGPMIDIINEINKYLFHKLSVSKDSHFTLDVWCLCS